ncbi:MAG: YlxR family protein [Candidatus Gastranaerophilaceae bacterium]
MTERKCVGCGKLKNRDELIKITKENLHGDVVLNPDSKIFGRSVYLCYNKSCIEAALKKNKLQKALRANISEELKGKLLNEF